jgi:hypothetical protein
MVSTPDRATVFAEWMGMTTCSGVDDYRVVPPANGEVFLTHRLRHQARYIQILKIVSYKIWITRYVLGYKPGRVASCWYCMSRHSNHSNWYCIRQIGTQHCFTGKTSTIWSDACRALTGINTHACTVSFSELIPVGAICLHVPFPELNAQRKCFFPSFQSVSGQS